MQASIRFTVTGLLLVSGIVRTVIFTGIIFEAPISRFYNKFNWLYVQVGR